MPNDYYTMIFTGEKTDELLKRVECELVVDGEHVGIHEEERGGVGDELGRQREGQGGERASGEGEKGEHMWR